MPFASTRASEVNRVAVLPTPAGPPHDKEPSAKETDGTGVGETVGVDVGGVARLVGERIASTGDSVGAPDQVGDTVGKSVGAAVGCPVRRVVGICVGAAVGAVEAVDTCVGARLPRGITSVRVVVDVAVVDDDELDCAGPGVEERQSARPGQHSTTKSRAWGNASSETLQLRRAHTSIMAMCVCVRISALSTPPAKPDPLSVLLGVNVADNRPVASAIPSTTR